MDNIENKLIEKSSEAFCMAIEVYNKPTIRYRVEGFALFICNAWELMLKAHIIKAHGIDKIYYKDNPKRTISLENCIGIIFTNQKAPLRKNLEKIIELRNTSTHFITEEYEMVYIPLFQSNVFNFVEKMNEFHGYDVTEVIPQSFLNLAVSMNPINEGDIKAKYPPEIAERLINTARDIDVMSSENNNASFSIRIDHYYYITKDVNKATSIIGIDNASKTKVQIVKEVKDPSNTHRYNAKKCIKEINNKLEREKILLKYKSTPTQFNTYHFDLFVKNYGLKENERYCYVYSVSKANQYSYSYQTIEFIFTEIKKDPENIIENMRKSIKNKLTPGAKEF